MKKVLIPTKLETIARDTLAATGQYTVVQDAAGALPELAKAHPDTYALIVRSEKVDAGIIDRLDNLKVIVRAGAGYDNIDTMHARRRGIDVMNTPGANANAVAEEVIAMLLADARHIIPADASARAGKWEKSRFMGRELTGKIVGIIGLGNIGQLLARRLSGFDVRLLGYDPLISRERAEEIGIELADLPEIFAQADCISLHIPENEETRGMINAGLLERMRPQTVLVNCARAGIIDEDALRRVKGEHGIRFLNDVYPKDAEGPKSVADIADIMLPHIGASTIEANTNAARRAAEELIDLDTKGITSFIVNRAVPEGLDEAYGRLAFTLTKLCRHLLGTPAKLKSLETSFYGTLAPFGEWLMIPIVTALGDRIEQPMDIKTAHKFLRDLGIDFKNREPDTSKKFDNSITIDLIGNLDSGRLQRVSVRGTVTEGILMISRINEFDRMYFEPTGPTVFFIYHDRPGVLGRIGAALAASDINIEDVRNPHHVRLNQSLAIMKVNKPVPPDIMQTIARDIESAADFYYDFG